MNYLILYYIIGLHTTLWFMTHEIDNVKRYIQRKRYFRVRMMLMWPLFWPLIIVHYVLSKIVE